LAVGPRADDGFHRLATTFQAVSLFEDLTVRLDEPGVFRVATFSSGPGFEVADDQTNLAVQAARLLADWAGDDSLGCEITISKAIPVAAGLAGGSADAAGTLLACADLWGLSISDSELSQLAAQLGSDVPFALLGGTAIGRGRGSELNPLLVRGTYHYVLALSWQGLRTPQVYQRFDQLRPSPPEPQVPEAVLTALAQAKIDEVGAALHNDLQEAVLALRPELSLTLQTGMQLGAVGAAITGSGPTAFFLAADADAAAELSSGLAKSGACASVRQVHGPVPGARLIPA